MHIIIKKLKWAKNTTADTALKCLDCSGVLGLYYVLLPTLPWLFVSTYIQYSSPDVQCKMNFTVSVQCTEMIPHYSYLTLLEQSDHKYPSAEWASCQNQSSETCKLHHHISGIVCSRLVLKALYLTCCSRHAKHLYTIQHIVIICFNL